MTDEYKAKREAAYFEDIKTCMIKPDFATWCYGYDYAMNREAERKSRVFTESEFEEFVKEKSMQLIIDNQFFFDGKKVLKADDVKAFLFQDKE